MKVLKIKNENIVLMETKITAEEFKKAKAFDPKVNRLYNENKEVDFVVELAEEPKIHKYWIELTEDKDSKKLFASVRLAKVDDVELAKLSGYNKKLDKVMENVMKVLNEIEEELKNITKEEIK